MASLCFCSIFRGQLKPQWHPALVAFFPSDAAIDTHAVSRLVVCLDRASGSVFDTPLLYLSLFSLRSSGVRRGLLGALSGGGWSLRDCQLLLTASLIFARCSGECALPLFPCRTIASGSCPSGCSCTLVISLRPCVDPSTVVGPWRLSLPTSSALQGAASALVACSVVFDSQTP